MSKIMFFLAFFVLMSCATKQMNDCPCTNNYLQSPDTAEVTNNFYDNTETFPLPMQKISVEGEVANPGEVDFSKLVKRSVIVKETLLQDDVSDKFIGAYRYDGYSLFDILSDRIPQKANEDEFNSIIDLYVEIENKNGEKALSSWGEIFYLNNLHKIIIATDVSRIIPSRSPDLWNLPSESKIVAAVDLITERNISSPVKIKILSYPRSFKVQRGLSLMYSDNCTIFRGGEQIARISELPEELSLISYNTIFYGRGRGIHSTGPFKGYILRDILQQYYPFSRESLREGMVCISGMDGYRCTLSFSELFNRNDQQEFLMQKYQPDEDGGLFRMFATPDFFSDRAIKSVSEIHLN